MRKMYSSKKIADCCNQISCSMLYIDEKFKKLERSFRCINADYVDQNKIILEQDYLVFCLISLFKESAENHQYVIKNSSVLTVLKKYSPNTEPRNRENLMQWFQKFRRHRSYDATAALFRSLVQYHLVYIASDCKKAHCRL